MQPIYVTLSSSGSSPWKQTNWHSTPQEISFTVLSTGGSSWAIDITYEDPTGTYPSPRSSAPTSFALSTGGSSNQSISLPSSMKPIAGYRFNLNSVSSVGASVTLIALQTGIG
jgi:hypothetical protein